METLHVLSGASSKEGMTSGKGRHWLLLVPKCLAYSLASAGMPHPGLPVCLMRCSGRGTVAGWAS